MIVENFAVITYIQYCISIVSTFNIIKCNIVNYVVKYNLEDFEIFVLVERKLYK